MWSISPGDGAFNKTTNRKKEIKTRTDVGTKVIINPQQAAKQMIVLPPDFSHVGELVKALIPFSRDNDNKDKKISIPLEI
jgi:hypothetical protein